MAPTQEHGQRTFFIVQYLQDREKCTWIDVNKTSDLSIYLPSLSGYFPNNTVRSCSVRVCFDGKKESKNTSCSREYKVYSSKCITFEVFRQTGIISDIYYMARQSSEKRSILIGSWAVGNQQHEPRRFGGKFWQHHSSDIETNKLYACLKIVFFFLGSQFGDCIQVVIETIN